MTPHWNNLNERERLAFRAVVAFLDGRLEERSTVEWAIRLKQHDVMRRLAVLELINGPQSKDLGDPWRSAWRLIEESWNEPPEHLRGTEVYQLQRRLRSGDRSGTLIAEIVRLVEPRLNVRELTGFRLYGEASPKRPKRVEDLFQASLAGGEVVDLEVLKLSEVSDRQFLHSLAMKLDAAVNKGLDLARRLGWDGETRIWQLGSLARVYFVPPGDRDEGLEEPDRFHHGIAPSVKLLHAATIQLSTLDFAAARELVQRWKHTNSSVHMRLWAAMARDTAMASPDELATFFGLLADDPFWNVSEYPEVAELRALRFREMSGPARDQIVKRIRRMPPRRLWSRRVVNLEHLRQARVHSALRELRRIELAGGPLPNKIQSWLTATLPEYPSVSGMSRLDDGAPEAPSAQWVAPNPDARYDDLSEEARLKVLEVSLSSARLTWENNEAERAADWMRVTGNASKLLDDFLTDAGGGGHFPRVWEHFGWSHSPSSVGEGATDEELLREAERGLKALARLPNETVRLAIDGISHWLSTWGKRIIALPEGIDVWLSVWPLAVEATNAQQSAEDEADLNTQVRSGSDQEPQDLDTLNTPAGRLIGVFLAGCPDLNDVASPFSASAILRTMRDQIMAATGRSSLIARHRMIQSLPYFLRADHDWADDYLLKPLLADHGVLWRATARRIQPKEVLEIVGDVMTERAIDMRLGRDTRRSLVVSVVVEALRALHEQRDPAVPFVRVQQMLRSLDDEVRAYGADVVKQFVSSGSSQPSGSGTANSTEELFRSSAIPFLQRVWPQDRSLATPGVSKAFADLPAAAQGAFAEAVSAIERFLVPFDCWSLLDYGLFGGDEGDNKRLLLINDQSKAEALVKLLDLTIGTAEGAIIPYDLPDALDQIRSVAPGLADGKNFRRLATLARRA